MNLDTQQLKEYVIIKHISATLTSPMLYQSFNELADLVNRMKYNKFICDMTEILNFEITRTELEEISLGIKRIITKSEKPFHLIVVSQNDLIIREVGRCLASLSATFPIFNGDIAPDIDTATNEMETTKAPRH